MRKTVLLGLMLCLAGGLMAQSKLKRAHKAFELLDYQEAIRLYSDVLVKNDDSQAKINLAECYRKVSNTEEAEYWYGQIVNLPEAESVHKLYYGMMLQTNGKCDLAKEWYVKYVKEVPDDLRGQYLVKACDYEDELMTKNQGMFEIVTVPFNTALDDFGPMIFKDGLVFASEYKEGSGAVKREHTWTGNPFLELYYVTREEEDKETFEYSYGAPDKFSSKLNSKFHDAAVSFSEDESTIFFTRNNYIEGRTGRDDEGAIRLKIFHATNEGGGSNWGNLDGLPFNSDEYSVAHPALTPDGTKLYFSSDMPGGFGGMDLYVSTQEDGRWGPPMNLGPGINTEGHEVFPYYSKLNRLYYASDGHIGLGGLDIYYMDDQGDGEWGDIVNLGFPINTKSDDFAMVMNDEGTHGYFSSDREGGVGDDDIYSWIKSSAPVEIFVYDEETGLGIQGASVVNDCDGVFLKTDKDGYARLEQKLNKCCGFAATAETYLDNAKKGCTTAVVGEKVIVKIPLSKPKNYEVLGVVYDEITMKPIPGALVELLPTRCAGAAPETVTTGPDGSYRFKLAPECCYEVRASKTPSYLATRSKEVCTTGLVASTTIKKDLHLKPTIPPDVVESNPVILDDNPNIDGGRGGTHPNIGGGSVVNDGIVVDMNRPVTPGSYLLHIYYDFDQSYIRDDALPQLNKLLALLKENSQYVVEIASHTDSRGSHRYNDRLSQRRAESVVRWLRDNGISRDRVKPKGYGETINVNQCANNIPCSEFEHQLNRRTEFSIVGYFDGNGNYTEIKKSSARSDVKVDPCQGCPF